FAQTYIILANICRFVTYFLILQSRYKFLKNESQLYNNTVV
ncbi:hypothetical protein EAI_06859, partial [Harpegnathos saltator]